MQIFAVNQRFVVVPIDDGHQPEGQQVLKTDSKQQVDLANQSTFSAICLLSLRIYFFLVICWVIKIATRITFSFFHFSQELHLDGPHELCIHTGPKRSRKDDNYEPDSEVAKSRLQALPVVLGWAYYLPANVLPINWLAANHVLASAGSVLVLRRGRASISRAEALRQEHQW